MTILRKAREGRKSALRNFVRALDARSGGRWRPTRQTGIRMSAREPKYPSVTQGPSYFFLQY
eukprot:scaffold870_cov268-Pinguiococcus_pyrenoidosus.AAC.69